MVFLLFGAYEHPEDKPFQCACEQHPDGKKPMQFAGKNESNAQEKESQDRVTCDDLHTRRTLPLTFCSFDLGISLHDSSGDRSHGMINGNSDSRPFAR
ncbi:hypothetical protein [Rhizobium sp. CIAT894]|uniref:hypothetical protein n=1 Tax=Rhizobium sp. CIAT894 TaxID=2020312 RepID=UPI0013DDF952|nr:hypothetical protein [Rhizobium sp. CIAT894]